MAQHSSHAAVPCASLFTLPDPRSWLLVFIPDDNVIEVSVELVGQGRLIIT